MIQGLIHLYYNFYFAEKCTKNKLYHRTLPLRKQGSSLYGDMVYKQQRRTSGQTFQQKEEKLLL